MTLKPKHFTEDQLMDLITRGGTLTEEEQRKVMEEIENVVQQIYDRNLIFTTAFSSEIDKALPHLKPLEALYARMGVIAQQYEEMMHGMIGIRMLAATNPEAIDLPGLREKLKKMQAVANATAEAAWSHLRGDLPLA